MLLEEPGGGGSGELVTTGVGDMIGGMISGTSGVVPPTGGSACPLSSGGGRSLAGLSGGKVAAGLSGGKVAAGALGGGGPSEGGCECAPAGEEQGWGR